MAAINAKFGQFGVHVAYGTLADYFSLIDTSEPAAIWPSFAGDFMPLATNQNVYSDQIDWNEGQAGHSKLETGGEARRAIELSPPLKRGGCHERVVGR